MAARNKFQGTLVTIFVVLIGLLLFTTKNRNVVLLRIPLGDTAADVAISYGWLQLTEYVPWNPSSGKLWFSVPVWKILAIVVLSLALAAQRAGEKRTAGQERKDGHKSAP